MQPKILVTDFDGTLTRREFYGLAQERLIPRDLPDFFEEYRHRRMTHFEALAAIFSRIRASDEQIEQLLTDMVLEPRLKELAEALQAAGWEVVVTSAGCEWYINELLHQAGVELIVHANPGILWTPGNPWRPEGGLEMTLPKASPFYSPTHGIDKAAVVRDAQQCAKIVAFAGDGYPDLPAAELVPAELRFARSMLAEALAERGLAYRPFEAWAEVAEAMLREYPA
jgi:2-hydroxy-3-keto-5-methylthiopentenyl-1-phosphate phosphatase